MAFLAWKSPTQRYCHRPIYPATRIRILARSTCRIGVVSHKEMTDQLKHKAYHSWVAIDIAKDYNVVMVELTDGKTRRFRMANSGKDHDRLIEVIRELPQPCHIGFEATGNYHHHWLTGY